MGPTCDPAVWPNLGYSTFSRLIFKPVQKLRGQKTPYSNHKETGDSNSGRIQKKTKKDLTDEWCAERANEKGSGLPLKGLCITCPIWIPTRQTRWDRTQVRLGCAQPFLFSSAKENLTATVRRGNSRSIQEVTVPFISAASSTHTDSTPPSQIDLHFNIPHEKIY